MCSILYFFIYCLLECLELCSMLYFVKIVYLVSYFTQIWDMLPYSIYCVSCMVCFHTLYILFYWVYCVSYYIYFVWHPVCSLTLCLFNMFSFVYMCSMLSITVYICLECPVCCSLLMQYAQSTVTVVVYATQLIWTTLWFWLVTVTYIDCLLRKVSESLRLS